jgi:uncharacterized damage-inducible protein DinB
LAALKLLCMKYLTRTIFITVFSFLLIPAVKAQTLEDIKAQLVKDWERAKVYTMEYLNAMPNDKYTFKANDSVRNFAQQMLHLANGNVFLVSQVSTDKTPGWFSFALEQRASAQNKDSVVRYITESYDYVINFIKNAATSTWGEQKKIFNRFDVTRFSMINKAFEHQSHHRGQATIYIRLVGVRPPQEKLF